VVHCTPLRFSPARSFSRACDETQCPASGRRLPRNTLTPTSRETTSTAELSGGSSRATILSLCACPYRATACYPRPQGSRSYPGGNCSDTEGPDAGASAIYRLLTNNSIKFLSSAKVDLMERIVCGCCERCHRRRSRAQPMMGPNAICWPYLLFLVGGAIGSCTWVGWELFGRQ
jgi:hypothetical protein